jgi:uncharacterized lipoprotein
VSGLKMVMGLLCLALLLGVSGCHTLRSKLNENSCSATSTYANQRSVPPLKVPPGLDAPDTANALRLPQLNVPAPPPRPKTARCLDEPPSFKVQKPPQA